MAKIELKEFKFEPGYGKRGVRVGRVWRSEGGRQYYVDWEVTVIVMSDCGDAYTCGDNSRTIATETVKNAVYVKAQECTEQLSAENFAVLLGKHFTSFYEQVQRAVVNIVEKPWERVFVEGQPHDHGFKLGTEKHTVEVIVEKSGVVKVTSGIEGLALLKTTQSGFEGCFKDYYTAFPETPERVLGTDVTATWKYSYDTVSSVPAGLYFTERYMDVKKVMMDTFFGPPRGGVYSVSAQNTVYQMARAVLNRFADISAVYLSMPNTHVFPVNIRNKDNQLIVKFDHDVYLPIDAPHGVIHATLSRA